VTICASKRGAIFGRLRQGEVVLGTIGSVVATHLADRIGRLNGVHLDAWIVMPDHVHAVMVLEGSRSLPALVGAFKAATTREIARGRSPAPRLWQRGYYEHIVRNEDELDRIRLYIVNNPTRGS
jgi:putative transposase